MLIATVSDQIDGALLFNTQFFNDNHDDGPGFDDVCGSDRMGAPDADAGEQDLLAATAGQMRRARPKFVNYAKRAKRVNVRKLKDNVWKGLNTVTAPQESEDSMVRRVLSCTRCAFPGCW